MVKYWYDTQSLSSWTADLPGNRHFFICRVPGISTKIPNIFLQKKYFPQKKFLKKNEIRAGNSPIPVHWILGKNVPALLFILKILPARLIPVKQGRVDVPFTPAQQPVQGARLTDGQVRPPDNPPDKDHSILPLEIRMMDLV